MQNESLSNYVFTSKYAKSIDGVPETYEQCVDRYLSTFEGMAVAIPSEVREALIQRKISGSQRGLQFGGRGIRDKNARAYNCSAAYCDRPRFFAEAMWLLLCGTGVGFSVQSLHVNKLPPIVKPSSEEKYVVADSIEGWSDAAHALMLAYFGEAPRPIFDFSEVRPAGSPISHGGIAPGPDPLAEALEKCEELLIKLINSGATHLRPIDCFDIVMHLSNAVLSGGIRRSACLTQFDLDDQEMMNAKTGDWFSANPQRARANISAVILPHHTKEQYEALFKSTKEFGEPGFLFLKSRAYVVNPCAEILMCPQLIKDSAGKVVDLYTLDMLEQLPEGYTTESGWQMCNLSTVNCAGIEPIQLSKYARMAALLGTLQASLTSFPYLGAVSEQIVRREALLGVSLTGVYSDRRFFEEMPLAARTAVLTNKYYAAELGINAASRVCAIKPEGTASISLGVVSSGIHPYHARKYIRRVQANALEPLYQYVEAQIPAACEASVWGGANARVISFACSAPENALTKSELSLEQHLSDVVLANTAWVRQGEGINRLEGGHHNVSVTFSVQDGEWDSLKDNLWNNRDLLTGVSMLGAGGDYVYQQAPLQEIFDDSAEEQHKAAAARWAELAALPEINFTGFAQHQEDYMAEGACSGGACLIPMWDKPEQPEAALPTPPENKLLIEIAEHLLRNNQPLLDQIKNILK